MKRYKNLNDVLITIGTKLAALRRKSGYESIREFAAAYKLPLIQYWRIEKGRANLTIKSLLKLLKIHSISLQKFFGDT